MINKLIEVLNVIACCIGVVHGTCMLKNYAGSLSLAKRSAYYAYTYYIITAYLAANFVYKVPHWACFFNIALVIYLFASDWRKVIDFSVEIKYENISKKKMASR